MRKDRAVDRAVFAYNLRHRKPEDRVEFDAAGRREIRSKMQERNMREQLDGLDITPIRIRR